MKIFSRKRRLSWKLVLILVACSVLLGYPALAAEKTWSGDGDATSWSDDDNWYPAVVPATTDDVSVDAEDASVTCDQTFNAKTLTLGGRETVTMTSENFVYGTIGPASTSDVAIYNRAGGKLKLKKAGALTLKGTYKDSEETLTREPSFIFWVE